MRRTAASHTPEPTAEDQSSASIARLVAAAAAGDEPAWESLVQLYSRRIYAMAKSRLHDADAAEEIAQSVFATLAAKLRDGAGKKYEELGKFEPWLFRITMNRVRDEGRRRRRRGSTTLRFVDAETPAAPGPAHADPDELDAMRDAIRSLDDRDREIIELRHHASLSFARIAETLGEPMGTVLARHHRAVRKLRQRIESALGETDQDSTHAGAPRAAGGSTHA
jgi:RNA polymerase sigma-70 factor (ECF subfamily)